MKGRQTGNVRKGLFTAVSPQSALPCDGNIKVLFDLGTLRNKSAQDTVLPGAAAWNVGDEMLRNVEPFMLMCQRKITFSYQHCKSSLYMPVSLSLSLSLSHSLSLSLSVKGISPFITLEFRREEMEKGEEVQDDRRRVERERRRGEES